MTPSSLDPKTESPSPLDRTAGIAALESISTAVPLSNLVASFVPTPRFADVSFENYRPTPGVPSQQANRDRLRRFVAETDRAWPEGLSGLFRLGRAVAPNGPGGIYLDGGFGVGKTHLLAAAYHAARAPKLYLSFAELAYTIIQMGLAESVAEFRRYDLICLDEFELDDIANTRMATMFLQGVMEGPGGARVITTSNTPPLESGRGRFAAEEFQREIGQIAARFEVVRIVGEDYRLRRHPIDLCQVPALDRSAPGALPRRPGGVRGEGLCHPRRAAGPPRDAAPDPLRPDARIDRDDLRRGLRADYRPGPGVAVRPPDR